MIHTTKNMNKYQFFPLCLLALFSLCTIALGADKFEFEYTESTMYSGNTESVIVTAKDNGQLISYTEVYTDASGQTVTPVAAGTYNYSVTFDHPFLKDLSGVFTIQQNTLTVSANSQSRQYGLSNPVLDYQITGFQGADNSSSVINGSPSLTTIATASSDVGSYTITPDVTGLSASNYNFIGSNGILSVTQAPLTIRADSTSRSYGEVDPSFTYSAIGFRNSDTKAVLLGEPFFSTAATSASTSGVYVLNVSRGSLSATNYALSFEAGTLSIGKIGQSLSGLPAQIQLSFGDPSYSLPAISSAGLAITYSLAPGAPSGVVQVSGSTLTTVGVGTVTILASQAGNEIYHPVVDAYIPVTVGKASFDMSPYPTLKDIALEIGKVVGITDLLAQSTSIPATFIVTFGATEGIVTDNGDQTITLLSEGSVVLRIAYNDPGGNYNSTPVYRTFDILDATHPAIVGGGDDGGGDGGGDVIKDPTQPPGAVPSDPPAYSPPLEEGIPVGDNWYYLDWFGFYYWDASQNQNFIYHLNHGWLYVPDPYLASTPLWMYSFAKRDNGSGDDMGWLYTQDSSYRYPYMAWLANYPANSEGTQIWFSQMDGQSQVFFNYDILNFGFMKVR
jgi:hypothetical protein